MLITWTFIDLRSLEVTSEDLTAPRFEPLAQRFPILYLTQILNASPINPTPGLVNTASYLPTYRFWTPKTFPPVVD